MRAVVCMFLLAALSFRAEAQTELTFSAAQAEVGEAAYHLSCARCHGESLTGAPLAPALLGESFIQRWAGRQLSELYLLVRSTMPPGGAEVISDSNYLAIIAYVLEAYGVQGTTTPLPSDVNAMRKMKLPNREVLLANYLSRNGNIASEIALPDWPSQENPLRNITDIDNDVLANPPEGSWITWRRTQDAAGFSPLRRITKKNVHQMRVAWTLALPAGPNQSTPLVHDGVMFLHSFGDYIQALDAATGDELWTYRPELRAKAWPRKNIALYRDKLFLTTSDSRLIALETRTGKVAWEWSGLDAGLALTGAGATIADGVVVQGAVQAGAGLIIGLDAASGRLLWRFHTTAQSGKSNGSSWNDLPSRDRTGGAVWLAGSYDPLRKLVLLGPAPTYQTLPLRNLVDKSGVTNDALYTNSTIALHPRTGALAWFYQHFPNDQWDLDWAFERHVIKLKIDGETRRIVLTSGKQAVYDAIDADTGQYAFSMDLGLQNLITGIDPTSGRKTVDRSLTPGLQDTVTVCPHALGAKSWLPASYDPERQVLYVPLVESCMDMVRVRRWGMLGGVRWGLRPRSGSDGRYGRLQAIDVAARKTMWTVRQRPPQTSGILATAGGVLFAGALDRWFTAYDADTGRSLWRVRLSDVPNSCPISYLARGKQYVAIVVGHGGYQSLNFLPLVPEIHLPAAHSSSVWVFEVPDRVQAP